MYCLNVYILNRLKRLICLKNQNKIRGKQLDIKYKIKMNLKLKCQI